MRDLPACHPDRRGGNVGFRSLYVGDPVSGNGMAAMTNGDKGEEVCNALRQRVATAYGWR